LDAALQLGIACGGWCPAGRRAEDGPIAKHYPLWETPQRNYTQRTEWNVCDSDGTVLLVWQRLIPGKGSDQTRVFALKHHKPCLVVDVSNADPSALVSWCAEHSVRVLNVAGPREGPQCPVYQAGLEFLLAALPFRAESNSARASNELVSGYASARENIDAKSNTAGVPPIRTKASRWKREDTNKKQVSQHVELVSAYASEREVVDAWDS